MILQRGHWQSDRESKDERTLRVEAEKARVWILEAANMMAVLIDQRKKGGILGE